MGVLTRDKGIEDSIDVFNLMNHINSEWQFWIVGRGESNYLSYLKEKIKRFHLESKVKFFGYVDQKKKFELLSKSCFLINPSIREGWGLVNIEANSVGTPVVGYKVPGMIDSIQIGTNGYLFRRGDIAGIAGKVLEITKDVEFYKKLSTKCKTWSTKFTWNSSIKTSLKLINNL